MGMFDQYFGKYMHYFDEELEKPIVARPAPERPDAQKGTDPGGPLTSRVVGITSNPSINQVQGFQEKLKEGASRVELGFMGTGKGSANAPTPESMGQLERQDLRDLAKLNKVETTVHAAPSVSNLSGFTQRGFSEQARGDAINEIKKAIDFAADASTGGAVVVHWDEWERPIEGNYGLKPDKGATFEGYSGEYKDPNKTDNSGDNGYGPEQLMFIDTETDKIIPIRRDMKFTEPKLTKVEFGEEYVDSKTGRPRKYLKYEYERDDNGEPIPIEMGYDDVIKMEKKLNDPNNKDFGAFAKFFSEETHEGLKELRNVWNEIENMPENDEVQKRKKNDRIFLFHHLRKNAEQAYANYQNRDSMWAYHQKVMRDDPRSIEQDKQQRDMAWVKFNEELSKLKNYKPLDEYSTMKAADTVAEAGVFAWQKSKEKEGQLHRNLYVAPESIFPQNFGSHPDEMMSMLDQAREKMKERLIKEGRVKDDKEAQKAAEESIKTTLDIGHLNMWRRHLKRGENESPEMFDKRFKEWALEKSKEMAKNGYVGHAHMTDNFGYGDEHLSVGDGNAPIREFVEELRRTGKVDDFIVEIGSYNAKTAMPEAWKNLGVSMGENRYFAGTGQGAYSSFSSMRGSYSGRTQKPSYVFGGYAPQLKSEKWQGWQPWTGIPL